MKKIILAIATVMSVFSITYAQDNADLNVFGEAFEIKSPVAPARVENMLKDTDKIENVQLIGYVNEVCQKMGCWTRIVTKEGTNDEVFVKMKDHAFFLPKDIAGRQIVINGVLSKKVQSVAEQQHYLEDAGAPQKDIDAITEPKNTYQFIASGVVLQ